MKKSVFPLLVMLAVAFSVYAEKPQSVQYIFPLDQSQFISRSADIIIRPGDLVDASTLTPELFRVVGDDSGEQTGDIVLSTDGKSIIVKPHQLFAANERVTVTVNSGLKLRNGTIVQPFDFSFTVTPLQQPINPSLYSKELYPIDLPDESVLQKTTAADSLPLDFPTFTVKINGTPAPGDIFFSPTRFVSNDGYNVRLSNTGELKYYSKIESGIPFDFKVLPNGLMSYGVMAEAGPGAAFGPTDFFLMDNSYSIVDEYQMGNGYEADYHDFLMLPNGHAFMISYDLQPVNMSGIVKNGHPGAIVVGGIIQELDQNKNVIFQWRSWDHYNLTDSYNDLSQVFIDAIHLNSLELDDDNNLIVSALALAEVTKINRQTGDILWRMGGKNNQFTFPNEDQTHAPLYFMYQHDVRRLPNGNLTMFDNGDVNLRKYSRVVEYDIDENSKTATKVWEYRHNPDIYSNNMGTAQRLPNGNTIIGWGFATMYGGVPAVTEVDALGNVIFELTFVKPLQASYRVFKTEYNGGAPVADIVVPELQIDNTYEFKTATQETGLSIKISQKDGFGYNEAVAALYNYAPLKPEFVAKAPMFEQVRIFLSQFNIMNVRAELYFDVDFYQLENPESVIIYHREFEGRGLFLPVPTVYNPATNKVVATMTKFGEFALAYSDNDSQIFMPWQIEPRNGAQVDQTKPVGFEWTPVGYTTEYTLQVAKDAEFATIVAEEQYITDAVYFMTAENNTTYYWRVKSYNDIGESDWSPASMFETRQPYIKVTRPKSNSDWRIGADAYLTWEDNIKEDVVLELFKGASFLMKIDTTTNTGAYKWTIPLHLDAGSDYQIKAYSVDNSTVSGMSENFALGTTSTVENEIVLKKYALSQNYPNPFNPVTQITYQLPSAGHVNISVYDIRGSLVATLVDEWQTENQYNVEFDGGTLSTGIYIYRMTVDDRFTESKKMLFVK